MEHVIGRSGDIAPGERRTLQVEGREICVFNVAGELFAVLNRCPHQGGPVCEGGLFEEIRADILPFGEIRESVASDGYILACPWHGWEYDIRSGRCLWNGRLRIRTYRVEPDADGRIVLHL